MAHFKPIVATLLAGTAVLASPAFAQTGTNTTALQHEVVIDGLENP